MTTPHRGCVLVVDDDPALRRLYTCYLEENHRVRTAPSGEAALCRIDDAVDVVLLDRRLRGWSGADVLAQLRSEGFDQPMAMITSVEPAIDIVDLPIDEYVVKPVDGRQLGTLVETLHRRESYDDVTREYLALDSRMAAVESRLAADELLENERYAGAARRLKKLEHEARVETDAAGDIRVSDEPARNRCARQETVTPL